MYKREDAQYKAKAFNGIVKLASLLQKALDTGRSNNVEMGEVSRYLNYYIKTQVDDSIRYLDYMLNNWQEDGKFEHLRNDLLALFEAVGESPSDGYEDLVMPNGSVSKEMLEELIQVDTEITSDIKLIRDTLMVAKSSGEIQANDLKEIRCLIEELNKNMKLRHNAG